MATSTYSAPQLDQDQIQELDELRLAILASCEASTTVRVRTYIKVWDTNVTGSGQSFRNVTISLPRIDEKGKVNWVKATWKLWGSDADLVGDQLALYTKDSKKKFTVEFDPNDLSYRPYTDRNKELQIGWDLKSASVYLDLICVITDQVNQQKDQGEDTAQDENGDHPF